jgi:putative salt-induced outer membrane protein YdiY
MTEVATFSTDVPVEIRLADGTVRREQLAAGEAEQVVGVDGQPISLSGIASINPPPQRWTGSVLVSGSIVRGNTHTEDLGVSINAALRRKDQRHDDRTTLQGAYNFGQQRDETTGEDEVNTDNWMAAGKYDYFWTPKLYGYANMKVEHDRIADLNYRLAPGVGLGYQWIERPDLNVNGETGITYVYEDYITGGEEDHIALRLAYHVDKKLNDKVLVFHNLEYLPAFEDPGDFNLTTDAGIRATLTETFFTEFRVEWKHDSTPAPDTSKNDYRYILGVGWTF